jgi:hypothetical protein
VTFNGLLNRSLVVSIFAFFSVFDFAFGFFVEVVFVLALIFVFAFVFELWLLKTPKRAERLEILVCMLTKSEFSIKA